MPPPASQLDDHRGSTVVFDARVREDTRRWELPRTQDDQERLPPCVVCRSSSALLRQSWISLSVPDPVSHVASVRASLQVNRLSEAFELPDLCHKSWLADPDTSPILKDETREQQWLAGRSSVVSDACPQHDKQDVQGEFLEGYKLFIVMACVSSVVFLMFLDGSILSPAIVTITDEFDSLADIGWYGSAYYLANTALQPLAGRFYSYFPSKWCLIVYVVLFMFGSLICGVAPSSNVFIIGRAVAGVGSSGILIGNLTVIAGIAPLEKRPSLTALVMSLSAPGMLFGPLVGGVITQYSSWRLVFYINLPFGGVIIPLLLLSTIPDQMAKPRAIDVIRNLPSYIDFLGFFLLSGASILFLLALNWGGDLYAWSSPVIIGTMTAAGVLLVLFSTWGIYKGEEALIPISVARKMVVWSGAMNLAFLLGATTVQAYFLPLYFQAVRGDSVMNSALYTLPGLPPLIIFSLVSGVLIGKMGAYLPWALAGAAVHTVACGLFSTFSPSSSAAQWVTYQVIAGAGRGMCMQSPSIAVQVSLPEDQISIASSILTFGMSMGQSIASTVASTAFTNVLTAAMTQAVEEIGEGAPSVESVLIAGATGFRDLVSAKDLPRMLLAYNGSIRAVFLLATVFSGLSFLFAFGLGTGDARKKTKEDSERDG